MSVPATDTLGAPDGNEQSLAHDMIEVHGAKAADIARDNAREAALAAQLPRAKHWLRVLALIQRTYRLGSTTDRAGRD